jgi:hypothetical protein
VGGTRCDGNAVRPLIRLPDCRTLRTRRPSFARLRMRDRQGLGPPAVATPIGHHGRTNRVSIGKIGSGIIRSKFADHSLVKTCA